MAILTDSNARNAAFLLTEANDWRSRDEVNVDASGGALEAGTILGRVTASGNFVRHAPGAADGSQNAVAILMFGIGAETGERTVIARDAEVIASALIHGDGATTQQQTDALTALAGAGIIAR